MIIPDVESPAPAGLLLFRGRGCLTNLTFSLNYSVSPATLPRPGKPDAPKRIWKRVMRQEFAPLPLPETRPVFRPEFLDWFAQTEAAGGDGGQRDWLECCDWRRDAARQ